MRRRWLTPISAVAAAVPIWLAAVLLLSGVLPAQEYSFRTFVTSDGLGNLSIQKIYQDRAGFLWVGTEDGVFRFDGSRFQPMNPATETAPGAVAFGEAPDGSLLVGSSLGLFRFTGSAFAKLDTPFKGVSWTQGIAMDGHGRTTYLGTEAGLFQMTLQGSDGRYAFERLYPAPGASPMPVYGVLSDGDAVWFGCGTELCKLQSGKVTLIGQKDGLPAASVVAIVKDGAGNLWLRIRNQGMLELPAGQTHVRRPDTPVPATVLTGTPGVDREGHVLLCTPDGLLIQQETGWQMIDRHVGVRGGVYSAFEDRQHSLWLGTGGRGLVQWRGYREWESYSSESGLPSDNVFEIAPQPDGTVWAATEAGVVRGERHGSSLTWEPVPGAAGIQAHSLAMSSKGEMWIGTANRGLGVLRRGAGTVQWYGTHEGIPARRAFTIRFDRTGHLWAATDEGVFVALPPYNRFERIAALPASWFWTVAAGPDGTVWAGGVDGLFALVQGTWRHWTRADGLSNPSVTAIAPGSDGWTWLGFQHDGIDRIRLTASGAVIQHGLQRPGTNGLIYFLGFDLTGRLWAGTEQGADAWDGSHWKHYDTTDGLIWDDCDLGGFAAASDGSLWFGTGGGLSRFTPPANPDSTAAPQVVFTELRMGTRQIVEAGAADFPSSSSALVAHFAAPEATHDSSLRYRYRLESASPWTETTQQQLQFTRLAPGWYHLEVEVRDRDGLWSPRAAQFAFTIQAPWYARSWFVSLLALLPLAGMLIVVRMRSTAAQKREQRLQRVVDERTRDLRNANEELLRLTMLDALTGLANRRRFDHTLARECERVRRTGSALSLVLLDVDSFKALNDSAGHQKGDEYLVILGKELMHSARRQIDVAARIGGEEFALILPATDSAEAMKIAESLRAKVENLKLPHPASPASQWLTVSLGVATASGHAPTAPEDLVQAADQALYRSKSNGRNRVEAAGAQTPSSHNS